MNSACATAEFILFDGAIVPMERIELILDGGYPGRCLYEYMGDEARRVSPWLVSVPSPAEALASEMDGSRTHAHGVSRLLAKASLNELVSHLQRLQTLSAGQKRYYLRYADGRSLADLWDVLSLGQREALLGPIETWETCPTDEPVRYTQAPGSKECMRDSALPLRLSTGQFSRLMQSQRDTQRWAIWLKTQSALAAAYTLEELRDLSRRTGAWLHVRGDVLSPQLVHAVGVAALRSSGEVFECSRFAGAVEQGIENDDRRPIDAWRHEGDAADEDAGPRHV